MYAHMEFFNGTQISPFYMELCAGIYQPALTILTGGKALIAVVGILLNLELVYISHRTPHLDGICNFLITAEALTAAIYMLAYIISFLVLVSGANVISLSRCFYAQLIPSFMKYYCAGLMVAIGLDRLKSVCFIYRLSTAPSCFTSKRVIQMCWLIPFAVPPAYLMWLSYGSMSDIRKKPVMCSPSEISQDDSASPTYTYALVLNIASPLIYCALGIVLLVRQKMNSGGQQQQHSKTGKIFKSIFVLMVVQLLGWVSNAVVMLFVVQDFDGLYASMSMMAMNVAGSYAIAIATAANAPILYFCSHDYRQAFNLHLSQLLNALHAGRETSSGAPALRNTNNNNGVGNRIGPAMMHQNNILAMRMQKAVTATAAGSERGGEMLMHRASILSNQKY